MITLVRQHHTFMEMALQESAKALPACLPNPPVGCILVKDGIVLARGYTGAPGTNHAEADAISNYQTSLHTDAVSLDGISAYVTLEPCSFHGRTPSCARALIDREISKVYIAVADPDPRNNGNGIKLLRNAGVEVFNGVLSEAVTKFLTPYLKGDK